MLLFITLIDVPDIARKSFGPDASTLDSNLVKVKCKYAVSLTKSSC